MKFCNISLIVLLVVCVANVLSALDSSSCPPVATPRCTAGSVVRKTRDPDTGCVTSINCIDASSCPPVATPLCAAGTVLKKYRDSDTGCVTGFACIGKTAAACKAPQNLAAEYKTKVKKDAVRFALNLYKKARAANNENTVFSPVSLSMALGMVMAGSKGNTQTELRTTLLHMLPIKESYKAFNWVQQQLNKPGKSYELNSANAMYVKEGLTLMSPYNDIIKGCFNSTVQLKDFATRPNEVREEINDWVEERTHNRIQDLLERSAVTPATSMVLVNAIYMKAEWLHPYVNMGDTFSGEFFPLNTPSVGKSVTMMTETERYLYNEDSSLDLKVLGMPYKNNELTMFFILPNTNTGLLSLESAITARQLEMLLQNSRQVMVATTIPKFRIDQSLPMNRLLREMGVDDLFDNADLSGITGDRSLAVSDVVHKAFIEVNEEGTEAAAATGISMVAMSAVQVPKSFRADHAFMFLVRHEATKTILFMGALTDVSSE